jgi:hypothetical protein
MAHVAVGLASTMYPEAITPQILAGVNEAGKLNDQYPEPKVVVEPAVILSVK